MIFGPMVVYAARRPVFDGSGPDRARWTRFLPGVATGRSVWLLRESVAFSLLR